MVLWHKAHCSLWLATVHKEQVPTVPIILRVTGITYRVRGQWDMSLRRHVAHRFSCQYWRKRFICRSIVARLQCDPTLTRGVIFTAGIYRLRSLTWTRAGNEHLQVHSWHSEFAECFVAIHFRTFWPAGCEIWNSHHYEYWSHNILL
jgi:hypothetical protein